MMRARGRLVAVCGVKGGVGTTAVAANLAAALSESGDTALLGPSGSAHEDLGLWFAATGDSGERDLGEALETGSLELLGEAGTKVSEGIVLLKARGKDNRWARAEAGKLAGMLKARFTWSILDLGSWDDIYPDSPWLAAAKDCEAFIGVATPDPLALRKIRRICEKENGEYFLLAVLNRQPSAESRGLFVADSSAIPNDAEFKAVINESREMAEAIIEGRPVVASAPKSKVAEQFKTLARLVQSLEPIPILELQAPDDSAFRTTAFRKLKKRLHIKFLERIRETAGIDGGDEHQVERLIRALVDDEGIPDLTPGFRARLVKELKDETLGLGPLQDLLNDPEVSEVMVNGPSRIYAERRGLISREPGRLEGEEELRGLIDRIVAPIGRRIDESSPLVDARLRDGSRVNAVIPPLALDGSCLTIRKFSRKRLGISDLVEKDSLTVSAADFLKSCVAAKVNLLISGGTGSGKTTLLNILASFVSPSERVVTIEDAAELSLPQEHVVRLEARPANLEGRGAVGIRELVRNSLRMRPDRIVVGEVRGGEALDMLQAMNTGHEGSLSTLHANSPRDALSRLETMVLMAGMELPLRAIREQVVSAIELIVQIARLKDGTRRVTRITEVTGLEGEVYVLQDVFQRKEEGGRVGKLLPSGIVPGIAGKLEDRGETLDRSVFFT